MDASEIRTLADQFTLKDGNALVQSRSKRIVTQSIK